MGSPDRLRLQAPPLVISWSTLREPAHDRTPGRLAVSDDALYVATLNYGPVEVIDLQTGRQKWGFTRYDGASVDVRGPRVFIVHDDSRTVVAVIHGLEGDTSENSSSTTQDPSPSAAQAMPLPL